MVSERQRLLAALERKLDAEILSASPVAGGDINDAYAVELAGGDQLFVKTRADVRSGEFRAEADGLRWLDEGGVRVPEAVAVGDPVGGQPEGPRFLALRWIEPGRLSAAGAEELGVALAALHRSGAPSHGWQPTPGPQRLGSLGLRSAPGEDWGELYAEQRLLPLARMAREREAIGDDEERSVEAVCERIDRLAGPAEPPARLHGDLWGGNVHADREGRPWLIDPNAHGGHREMDLAMLELFGAPSPRVIPAYEEAFPLAPGRRERTKLWQLQPLLVHAILFGGHYGTAAAAAARSYL